MTELFANLILTLLRSFHTREAVPAENPLMALDPVRFGRLMRALCWAAGVTATEVGMPTPPLSPKPRSGRDRVRPRDDVERAAALPLGPDSAAPSLPPGPEPEAPSLPPGPEPAAPSLPQGPIGRAGARVDGGSLSGLHAGRDGGRRDDGRLDERGLDDRRLGGGGRRSKTA